MKIFTSVQLCSASTGVSGGQLSPQPLQRPLVLWLTSQASENLLKQPAPKAVETNWQSHVCSTGSPTWENNAKRKNEWVIKIPFKRKRKMVQVPPRVQIPSKERTKIHFSMKLDCAVWRYTLLITGEFPAARSDGTWGCAETEQQQVLGCQGFPGLTRNDKHQYFPKSFTAIP